MAAVAEGGVGSVFALAKVGFAVFFCGERFGGEACSFVGAVAEGLVGGFSAGAEVILFSFFEFDGDGAFCGNDWFVHSFVRLVCNAIGEFSSGQGDQ